MSEEQWCREKLSNLHIKEHQTETLNEIRTHLNATSGLETRLASNLLTATEIYDCLDDNTGDEQKCLVTDILSICMSNLDLDQVDIPNVVEKSLKHSNPSVRAIALTEIQKVLERDPSRPSIDPNVILAVISCLGSTETCDSAVAIKILSKVLVSEYDNRAVKSALEQYLAKGDVIRCRVYEIVVNLARTSPTMLQKVQNIIDKALAELDTDDALLQLSILELLVSLAEQNHGFSFLEDKRVFEKISKRIKLVEENPLEHFLIQGIMKFFGKIASTQPEKIICGYPVMVQCLFECFNSGDVFLLPTAFDTLANLANTPQGKIVMEANYSENLEEAFKKIASYLRNLPTDMKNRLFGALEVIFHVHGELNNQVNLIAEKWCSHVLGSMDFQILLDFVKNPFPDIKISCLNFIKTLCAYYWGIVALKNTAGFLEYLLDRRVEFDKDAKMVKYEIISILSEYSIFDAQTILQLKRFVGEGPYYQEGIVEVAVDGC